MDSYIGLPTDGVGKKVDADQLTVSGQTVLRERDRIAGAGAAEVADVRGGGAEAGGSDYALVVRRAPPVSPQRQTFLDLSLAANGTQTFTCSPIPSSLTGFLQGVALASTGLIRWTIQAAAVNLGYRVTNGGSGDYTPPSKFYDTTPSLSSFVIVAQNIGPEACEVYCTVWWDQV